MSTLGFDIRPYEPADAAVVLDLLGHALDWEHDELHAQLFAWKHGHNPFGESPAWVATVEDRVVGFRTFLRWEFVVDGQTVRAVRAVDTVTDSGFRGRGVFSGLTEHALAALREEGVAFVFNTPNDQSRPGYLNMGWRPVRRLPVRARPRSVMTLGRIARAATPAQKWSVPSAAGVPASEAFGAGDTFAALRATVPGTGLHTNATAAYLRWRYGFAPLAYRVFTADAVRGAVVFRLRRRGPALEAAVCEELVPHADPRVTRLLLGAMLKATGADYAVRLGEHLPRAGFVLLPGRGPVLVCRELDTTAVPAAANWHLGLGDIELF